MTLIFILPVRGQLLISYCVITFYGSFPINWQTVQRGEPLSRKFRKVFFLFEKSKDVALLSISFNENEKS